MSSLEIETQTSCCRSINEHLVKLLDQGDIHADHSYFEEYETCSHLRNPIDQNKPQVRFSYFKICFIYSRDIIYVYFWVNIYFLFLFFLPNFADLLIKKNLETNIPLEIMKQKKSNKRKYA